MTDRHDRKVQALFDAIGKNASSEMTIKELAEQSGYEPGTLRTYITKNKLAPHVVATTTGRCRIDSVVGFSLGDLQRAISQRQNRYTYEHLGVSELVSSLLDRSRTNAGLALELINRPELANRLDAFVLLLMTAWEQLLKAELEHGDPGSIFTGAKSAAGRPMTIGITQALERVFPQRHEPVRKNIEALKELRDGAAHLLVPEVSGIATRYFQSSILNYIDRFGSIASGPPFRFEGTGLLTLGVAYSAPKIEVLRARYGSSADEIDALITSLADEATTTDDKRFAVSLEYELVLERKPGPHAVRLTSAPDGAALRTVKVPRDPKDVCPHTTTDCAKLLSQRTGRRWSTSDVAVVAEHLGLKGGDNEFHYTYRHGKAEYHNYSPRFVEHVAQRYDQNQNLVSAAHEAKRKKSRTPRRRGQASR